MQESELNEWLEEQLEPDTDSSKTIMPARSGGKGSGKLLATKAARQSAPSTGDVITTKRTRRKGFIHLATKAARKSAPETGGVPLPQVIYFFNVSCRVAIFVLPATFITLSETWMLHSFKSSWGI